MQLEGKHFHDAKLKVRQRCHAKMHKRQRITEVRGNQTDEAFEWLDRAYAQRDPSLMATKLEPLLKSLHNDPRYAAFLKKLNLPN